MAINNETPVPFPGKPASPVRPSHVLPGTTTVHRRGGHCSTDANPSTALGPPSMASREAFGPRRSGAERSHDPSMAMADGKSADPTLTVRVQAGRPAGARVRAAYRRKVTPYAAYKPRMRCVILRRRARRVLVGLCSSAPAPRSCQPRTCRRTRCCAASHR